MTDMGDADSIYEIRDGVRRAKAADICGHETIAARVGDLGPVIQIPLKNLRSPREEIETHTARGFSWGIILRRTQRGETPPPIIVERGESGTPIRDIAVEEDVWDVLRKSGRPT